LPTPPVFDAAVRAELIAIMFGIEQEEWWVYAPDGEKSLRMFTQSHFDRIIHDRGRLPEG